MARKTIFSALILIYINILPYLCRLPKGVEWALEILPDKNHLFQGLLFFHAFYSIPAVLLIIAIFKCKTIVIPCSTSILCISITTTYLLYSFDISADAQSAIGLIFLPIITTVIGGIGYGVGHLICFLSKN